MVISHCSINYPHPRKPAKILNIQQYAGGHFFTNEYGRENRLPWIPLKVKDVIEIKEFSQGKCATKLLSVFFSIFLSILSR